MSRYCLLVAGTLLALFALSFAPAAHAESLMFCLRDPEPSPAQQDELLRFAAVVKGELEASGQRVALVSRSGLDLSRIGERYSHAGLSLKASANTPWSVRQLYFDCHEHRPRIFDQGLTGFLLGMNSPNAGYVSVVLLPPERAAALERAALDDRADLSLLGRDYSVNAYAWSTRYQNCNQWVAELFALAWGNVNVESPRPSAQAWLREAGYRPSDVAAGPLLVWGALFTPWTHDADHPREDLAAGRFKISLPVSLEAFVKSQSENEGSGAQRIEFCHAPGRVVVHHGWTPLAEGCQAGEGDQVVELNPAR